MYDCDEKKTADVIQLLQTLQKKYVPMKEDGTFVEPIFFGGEFFFILCDGIFYVKFKYDILEILGILFRKMHISLAIP